MVFQRFKRFKRFKRSKAVQFSMQNNARSGLVLDANQHTIGEKGLGEQRQA
jgi:hypothetical protein